MITINGQTYALDDPAVLAVLIGGAMALLMLVLLGLSVRAGNRSARLTEPMIYQLSSMGQRV